MSFAIIRNQNYKKDSLSYLYRHNERKNTNYSNKDINKEQMIKNYSIKDVHTTYLKRINELIKEHDLKGRIISTTNVLCEFIITSDKEYFDKIGEEETKRFFKVAYTFVANYQKLGEEYIISAKIHNDESTPHMHITFVPVVHKYDSKSGKNIDKIACSEYWKGKDSYRKLQDMYYNYMIKAGFDLERGKSGNIEHLSTEKLKQVTEYEKIKKEIEKDPIREIDSNNLPMVINQNRELIEYVNKLKFYLKKSVKAVDELDRVKKQNEELNQVNNELNEENEELQKENKGLKNLLEKTYEYVNILFDFPKERLKRLVKDFIEKIKE